MRRIRRTFNMSEIQSIERKRAIPEANRGVDTKYMNEVNGLSQEEEKDRDHYCRISRTLPLAGSHNRTIYLRTIWGLYFLRFFY